MARWVPMDDAPVEMRTNLGTGAARRRGAVPWKRTKGPKVLTLKWSSNSCTGVEARGPK